jgi:hypothetical protein
MQSVLIIVAQRKALEQTGLSKEDIERALVPSSFLMVN